MGVAGAGEHPGRVWRDERSRAHAPHAAAHAPHPAPSPEDLDDAAGTEVAEQAQVLHLFLSRGG